MMLACLFDGGLCIWAAAAGISALLGWLGIRCTKGCNHDHHSHEG